MSARRVAGVALRLFGGLFAAGLAVAEEARDRLPEDCTSPFLARRQRALEVVARSTDAAGLARLLGSADLEERRVAAAVGRMRPELLPLDRLVASIAVEQDPRTLRLLGDALHGRLDADSLAALREALPEKDRSAPARELYDRAVLSAVQALFESRISDGSIPGFYDGQFESLWPLDPQMAERLIQYSRDPGLHFVVRALAVMALHETRRPSLPEDLAPLLLPVELEFKIDFQSVFDPRPDGPEVVDERRRADLSKYVRFSLAKAGRPEAILEMVARMDEEISRGRTLLDSRFSDPRFLDSRENFFREWLLDLLFETGYYHQQYDDYDRAAERYRRLIENYPEARSCQNAHYNLACIESIRGHLDSALFHLRAAVRLGFTDYAWLLEDGDLAPLRELPLFHEIVEAARSGGGAVTGRDWMRVLATLLPPERSLFELTEREQEAVLQRARPLLGPEEVTALLESAPAGQRLRLSRLLGR